MITALEQYSQMGVFDKLSGIILGTFTHMEENRCSPSIEEIVLKMTPESIPVAKTRFVGHYETSRAIPLGAVLTIGQ